jgi:hypothetical protein
MAPVVAVVVVVVGLHGLPLIVGLRTKRMIRGELRMFKMKT